MKRLLNLPEKSKIVVVTDLLVCLYVPTNFLNYSYGFYSQPNEYNIFYKDSCCIKIYDINDFDDNNKNNSNYITVGYDYHIYGDDNGHLLSWFIFLECFSETDFAKIKMISTEDLDTGLTYE